jgi:hypothetical protein
MHCIQIFVSFVKTFVSFVVRKKWLFGGGSIIITNFVARLPFIDGKNYDTKNSKVTQSEFAGRIHYFGGKGGACNRLL